MIVCVICFILNVLDSFEKFLNNSTIQTSFTQTENTELPLPTFMVCNGIAYNKTQNVSASDKGLFVSTESQYNGATRDPKDLNVSVNSIHWTPLDANKYSMDVLNTVYHGRCVLVQFLVKVSGPLFDKT